MKTWSMAGIALAASVTFVAPAVAQDSTVLALSCAACHGTDGKSPSSIPAIAGKNRAFIEESLTDFKSGKRAGTVMNRLAKGYSDDEIKALAVFFSGRK